MCVRLRECLYCLSVSRPNLVARLLFLTSHHRIHIISHSYFLQTQTVSNSFVPENRNFPKSAALFVIGLVAILILASDVQKPEFKPSVQRV